eukprot:TRINITY_DN8420_c0_g1_i2.p1 TRINITY_DN8420_c0_g1~~TRINITY_DN8420_c0_g1_i2.p1  ORF type:complete len:270 (+),score=52.83 TRINITY_DN8420_c0_g1_i2:682-1491(+)
MITSETFNSETFRTISETLKDFDLLSRFEFLIYLTTRFDLNNSGILTRVGQIFSGFPITVVPNRYPNSVFTKRTHFRYNWILSQSFVDDCDFTLILSDRVQIMNHSIGWPQAFADCFSANGTIPFGICKPREISGKSTDSFGLIRTSMEFLHGAILPSRISDNNVDRFFTELFGEKYFREIGSGGFDVIDETPKVGDDIKCELKERDFLEEIYSVRSLVLDWMRQSSNGDVGYFEGLVEKTRDSLDKIDLNENELESDCEALRDQYGVL